MIPQETVNLILDTAQIEDVVGDFVTLKRRGANYVACCPFHNEKTPSFYVSPAKGIYKCFGCQKSGSSVGFVMEHEHCSYADALRYLARKYHIEIVETEESAEEIARRQRSESLMLVCEFAQKFFAGNLASGEGRAVGYAYFRSRGLEDETIERFGLGWAPSGRTAFIDAATAAGFKMEYILGAGLAVQHEDGSVGDKFRERAMFPIHSVSGRVIAFSGRTLRSDNPAKYVNSPETEIYVKSRILLGIYFAKSEISRLGKCILVEGNVDMVTMHQLGIRNVVASCGTSLTVEQVRLIRKFTENVTIMYDGDSAGIHAAIRGLGLVLEEGLNVKIVLLPEGEDPDSFGRSHTLEEVQAYIASGERDFVEFKTDLLLSEAGSDPIKKANLINDIADTIALIPDPVKRSVYVELCSSKFGIESSILFERISRTRDKSLVDKRQRELHEKRQTVPSGEVPPPVSADAPQSAVDRDDNAPYPIQNRILAPVEKEILGYLLTNGTDELDFESDSDYYSGSEDEKTTVAEFIRASLEADSTRLSNTAFANLYDAYMALYDEGLTQEKIVESLLNSPDRERAAVAADLSFQKYFLSVKKLSDSMTTTSSWLVNSLPKTMMVYIERRLQDGIEKARRSLNSASEADTEPLLREMMRLQSALKKVREHIGREKK